MTNDQLAQTIDAYKEAFGIDEVQAVEAVVAIAVLALASEVPDHILPGLFTATSQTLNTATEPKPLEPIRVAAWQHLDEKNGSSTVVADSTDRALRLLILIAWDEGLDASDTGLALEFLQEVASEEPILKALLST